ncbi:hypothetical protein Bbelb_419510 [Branchiostoma belcheri]|nr:hypothetical protein Bbelb_437580 [Branchiostoma belcheri]KAI8480303.1 hypothetical protein Bbelb_419510 [Branchiostoma belcheri]
MPQHRRKTGPQLVPYNNAIMDNSREQVIGHEALGDHLVWLFRMEDGVTRFNDPGTPHHFLSAINFLKPSSQRAQTHPIYNQRTCGGIFDEALLIGPNSPAAEHRPVAKKFVGISSTGEVHIRRVDATEANQHLVGQPGQGTAKVSVLTTRDRQVR